MHRVQAVRLGFILSVGWAAAGCGKSKPVQPAASSPLPATSEVPGNVDSGHSAGAATSEGSGAEVQSGPVAAEGVAPMPTLECAGRHYYFDAGDGSYALTLQEFKRGNKRDATVCIEGPSHNCDRPLVRQGVQQWAVGETWIVIVSGRNHIQIWNSEYDGGGAGDDSDGNCSDGNKVSAAILTGTNGFSATIVVRRI